MLVRPSCVFHSGGTTNWLTQWTDWIKNAESCWCLRRYVKTLVAAMYTMFHFFAFERNVSSHATNDMSCNRSIIWRYQRDMYAPELVWCSHQNQWCMSVGFSEHLKLIAEMLLEFAGSDTDSTEGFAFSPFTADSKSESFAHKETETDLESDSQHKAKLSAEGTQSSGPTPSKSTVNEQDSLI